MITNKTKKKKKNIYCGYLLHTHARIFAHTHTHIHPHTYTHTHTHKHTHTQLRILPTKYGLIFSFSVSINSKSLITMKYHYKS